MGIDELMMYRVFLLDEKDAPDSLEKPENNFRINWGKFTTWTYIPSKIPTAEEQVKKLGCGGIRIGPYETEFNGHLVIGLNDMGPGSYYSLDVVHSSEDLYERIYMHALKKAEIICGDLIKNNREPYYLINLTSKGDKEEAEKLSKKMGSDFLACVFV